MNIKNTVKSILAAGLITAGAASLWGGAAKCGVPEGYMATNSTSKSDNGDGNSPNNAKQCLCHNAGPNLQKKTLCLPPNAYQAHIAQHVDTPGPCPAN